MTGTAGGAILPSTFVTRSTTVDAQFLQATGGTLPIAGISGTGTRYPPYSSLNDGNIAIAGENFRVYLPTEKEAPLQLGGTVAAGDLLTSDSVGRGITAAPTLTAANALFIGARALMAGTINQIISVQPLFGNQMG